MVWTILPIFIMFVSSLKDLLEAFRSNTTYFLGAIVVIRPKNKGPSDVVDGQQRLTTLTILMAVMRDISESPDEQALLHSMIGHETMSMIFGGGGGGRGGPRDGASQAPARSRGSRPEGGGGHRYDDAQPPRANAHLGTHLGHSNPGHRSSGHGAGGQPDPMRTSVDSMADRGRRGGFGGGACPTDYFDRTGRDDGGVLYLG